MILEHKHSKIAILANNATTEIPLIYGHHLAMIYRSKNLTSVSFI